VARVYLEPREHVLVAANAPSPAWANALQINYHTIAGFACHFETEKREGNEKQGRGNGKGRKEREQTPPGRPPTNFRLQPWAELRCTVDTWRKTWSRDASWTWRFARKRFRSLTHVTCIQPHTAVAVALLVYLATSYRCSKGAYNRRICTVLVHLKLFENCTIRQYSVPQCAVYPWWHIVTVRFITAL